MTTNAIYSYRASTKFNWHLLILLHLQKKIISFRLCSLISWTNEYCARLHIEHCVVSHVSAYEKFKNEKYEEKCCISLNNYFVNNTEVSNFICSKHSIKFIWLQFPLMCCHENISVYSYRYQMNIRFDRKSTVTRKYYCSSHRLKSFIIHNRYAIFMFWQENKRELNHSKLF